MSNDKMQPTNSQFILYQEMTILTKKKCMAKEREGNEPFIPSAPPMPSTLQ